MHADVLDGWDVFYEEVNFAYPYIHTILEAAWTHRSILPRLCNVSMSGHIRTDDQIAHTKIEHSRLYHMIPSITSFRGYGIGGEYNFVDVNKHTTSICLIGSDLKSNALNNFLRSFHNLENLEYHHGYPRLVSKVMQMALINSKDSLKPLKTTAPDECLPYALEEAYEASLVVQLQTSRH
jgi:hypothetical protein